MSMGFLLLKWDKMDLKYQIEYNPPFMSIYVYQNRLCHHFQKNYWKNGKNSIKYQSNYEKKYGRGFS